MSIPALISRPLATVVLAIASILVIGTSLQAYPKPAPVPYRWELDFSCGPLRLWVDARTGETYWFTTYKVVNNTGKDQIWAPEFTLFNDQGQILASGDAVPRQVTNALLELLGNPLIEPQNAVIGEILQGEPHAREGLVVWRAGTLDVNDLTMFIAGISGETAALTAPNGKQYTLRKTLRRAYLVPGNVRPRGTEPVPFINQEWVLR